MTDTLKPVTIKPVQPGTIATPRYYCSPCSDTGVVLAQKIAEATGPYAFRCYCGRGERDRRKFPQWSESWMGQYKLCAR